MFKKTFLLDTQKFKKENYFDAKRPTEFWLLFLKKNILIKHKARVNKNHSFLLIPLTIVCYLLLHFFDDSFPLGGIVPVIFFSVFASVILRVILFFVIKSNFIDLPSFLHLAKFIINLKGDVYKNVMSLRINLKVIENKEHSINPNKLGLKKVRGVRYNPFELERYCAEIPFKDGSYCIISLHQICLKVTTTKRGSSGKTKTKSKYKHKLFYQLQLKLREEEYKIINTNTASKFELTISNKDGYYLLKMKHKEKLGIISKELSNRQEMKESIFTEMIQYLYTDGIVNPNKTATNPNFKNL